MNEWMNDQFVLSDNERGISMSIGTRATTLASALVSLFLLSQEASAFPLTSNHYSQPFSLEFKQDGFNFDAIVGLSNCSGSFIRFKNSRDDDAAMVLTNGHCAGGSSPFGGMLKPGEVYYQKARRFNMSLLDRSGRTIISLRAEKIIYATMTDTDITLLELNQTYKQIREASGVEALLLADQKSEAGVSIEIPSGYWKRTYACQIEAFIPTLKEGDWTFKDSLRYSPTGCDVIGGTSGSPIVSVASGQVIAINNTGNESGQRCTMNNPCEVDENGNIRVIRGRGYGQQTYKIYTCVTDRATFDLNKPGCALPRGAN